MAPLLFLTTRTTCRHKLMERLGFFYDDCLLYRPIQNDNDAEPYKDDIDNLHHWEHDWQMNINCVKCEVISIANKRNIVNAYYRIHSQELQQANQAKYLGVTLGNNISWNSGMNSVAKKDTHFCEEICQPAQREMSQDTGAPTTGIWINNLEPQRKVQHIQACGRTTTSSSLYHWRLSYNQQRNSNDAGPGLGDPPIATKTSQDGDDIDTQKYTSLGRLTNHTVLAQLECTQMPRLLLWHHQNVQRLLRSIRD